MRRINLVVIDRDTGEILGEGARVIWFIRILLVVMWGLGLCFALVVR